MAAELQIAPQTKTTIAQPFRRLSFSMKQNNGGNPVWWIFENQIEEFQLTDDSDGNGESFLVQFTSNLFSNAAPHLYTNFPNQYGTFVGSNGSMMSYRVVVNDATSLYITFWDHAGVRTINDVGEPFIEIIVFGKNAQLID